MKKMETDQTSECHESDDGNKNNSSRNGNIFTNNCNLEDTTALEDETEVEETLNSQNKDDGSKIEGDKDGETSSKHSSLKDDMNAYILRASEKGRYDIVEKLLERDPKLLNATDADNYTPLHRSVYSGHVEIVKLLLSKNAKVDASTIDGWQPLHCACHWSQIDIAFLLLQNGADINAQTNGGLTPLHLAAATSCKSILEMLLMNRYLNWNLKNAANENPCQVSKCSSKNFYLFEITEDRINLLK
ncbi:ankyrin repeat domain-containing protein 49 isoform X2 [Octopus bimaculoides]|uniref:ankyrin repeat domain-containing protein 49 isoform X2 n=1 Tax=Octopus bimaculoides TaxID=37653 RepID=UPI0022E581F5|nr:ankyrin repeat domain-containing protein 49 isoform X2 [Octopus bimaculoides]